LPIMLVAAEPLNEASRLQALLDFDILDTPPEAAFDRLVRIAAAVLDTPIAIITLVDGSRQWFKARVGIEPSETPREWAFCSHALIQTEPLLVLDAAADPRFAANPLVTENPSFRFYCGTQLNTASGETLGTLCVIDRIPRPAPDPAKMQVLRDLADLVMEEIELRRLGREARAQAQTAHAVTAKVQIAHAALKRAFTDKSDFLSSLSHELRSPLNAVIGLSEMIASDAADETLRGYAEVINTSGNHMLSLVTDILEYSRLEAGASPFHPEPTDLRHVAEEAGRMVAVFARTRGVKLVQDIAGPALRVMGDAVQLKQILLNLLTNAIKFTPDGGSVTLTLETAGPRVTVRVRDTGIGIAEPDIARALTRFGQVVPQDEAGRNKSLREGTGLGLPIVMGLVAQHGGSFDITSTPGMGTCVSIGLDVLG
jgi:signal transduction histidine kinase